jgi:hypothetical protein
VLRAVADGTLAAGRDFGEGRQAGRRSQVINGSEILLGAPFVFTKAEHRRLRLLIETSPGRHPRLPNQLQNCRHPRACPEDPRINEVML